MNVQEYDWKKYKIWLKSADPYQRGIAIAVFWHIGIKDDEVGDDIIHVLRTDNVISIRRDAVRMIRELKDIKFLNIFLELLNDEDWLVRGEAFLAIKNLGFGDQDHTRIRQFIESEVHPFCRFCIERG